MHAVALGHFKVTKAMMECNRSGIVTIDMNAQDDNGFSAMDHAKVSKDLNNSILQQQASSVNSEKIKHLLESYNESVGGVESSPKKVTPSDGIELVDMTHLSRGKKKIGPPSDIDYNQGSLEKEGTSEEEESSVDRNTNIRRWAVDLKQQHEESGRMSALLTSPANPGRPASRLGTEKGSSALDKATPTKISQPKAKSESENCTHPNLNVDRLYPSEDEDEEISLQSLSELVGTVRQYAQEIREIYAPIQKEEEERTKRRNEKNERRRQKTLHKQASIKSDVHPTGSFQHEVTVEIHKIEHESRKPDKPPGPLHSRSHDPARDVPLASLHVENEQLSSTWPRGRQRPRSRDRYRHDMHVHAKEMDGNRDPNVHGSTSSIASAPNPGTFTRPRIPSDWGEGNSLQQEREILNKAFKKLVKTNDDPLLRASNPNQKMSKLKEQLASSRQSVIQIGKSHQQSKKAEVPSISVIPPPDGEFGHRALSPQGPGRSIYSDSVLPSGPLVSEKPNGQNGAKRYGRDHKKSGNEMRAGNKSGLRRRKSVDQGMGQHVFLDKY